jgi:hypothetical protein
MRRTRGIPLIAVLLAAAGCTTPADPVAEPPAAPTSPTASPTASATPTGGTDRPDRPGTRGGARAQVPDAVILEQLRRAAERIAQNYTAPPTPTPADIDPDTNRGLGYQLMLDFGFPVEQWPYLDALWHRESGWNHLAENPRSGAYGIPQSLPAGKMAIVGDDWRTNPDTQIRWGLAYIAARYGLPEKAWQHSERVGWY